MKVPHGDAPVRHGFTLVEVLVALVVLAINVAAMTGALSLIADLIRAASDALAGAANPPLDLVCGSAALADRSSANRRRHRGLTLVEMLIALAITSILLATFGAVVATTSRTSRSMEEGIEGRLTEHGLRLVLTSEIGRAGEGLPPDGCGLVIGADGDLEVRWQDGPDVARVEIRAGTDASGRPALYRRRHPHARQPWLEDVVGFDVVGSEFVERGGRSRIAAVTVRVAIAGARGPLDLVVPLPHQPCLGDGAA